MYNKIERLFDERGEINPDYQWVADGKGSPSVWWDSALLYFEDGKPMISGDISETQYKRVLQAIIDNKITRECHFICGPEIMENIYRFDDLTILRLDAVKVPYSERRTAEKIRRYLLAQGYRGIVFTNPDLDEHNACFVTLKQLQRKTG